MRVFHDYEELSKPGGWLVAIKTAGRVVLTILRALSHVACWSFVLVLPIGYYPGNPDSTDLVVGVHGGYGQVASVIRGCEGEVLHSEASSFSDVSYFAYMTVPPGRRSAIVLGVRGGYWGSRAGFARRLSKGVYGRSPERQINFSYVNPNLNIETKYVGMGIGYVFGEVPTRFKNFDDPFFVGPGLDKTYRVSGHVRLGNVEKGYLAVSIAENTPLVSGGGIYEVGVGYRVGRSVYLFSGLAGGFYNGCGFIQEGRFKLNSRLCLDVALRLGGSGGVSENAISGGIIYRFGATKRAKP